MNSKPIVEELLLIIATNQCMDLLIKCSQSNDRVVDKVMEHLEITEQNLTRISEHLTEGDNDEQESEPEATLNSNMGVYGGTSS